MSETLRLGQGGARTGKPVWLTIVHRDGQYLTWSEADDEEYREILKVEAGAELPAIQVNRLNTPARSEYVRKRLRKYAKVGKSVPQEIRDKVTLDSIAHETLADWRHIANPDGEVLPYSPEVGIQNFEADQDFYEAVLGAAMDEDNHRSAALKEDADALGEA